MPGGALVFNGTNSWVTVPDSPNLHLTTQMTLETWAYPTASSEGWRDLIMKEQPGGAAYYLASRSPSENPACGIYTGESLVELLAGTALPLNTWTHVAMTCNGTTMSLYRNGTLVGTLAQPGPTAVSTDPLRIGGNSVWDEFFQGRIDEVRIYNRALTVNEISADMNAPINSPPPPTPTPNITAVKNWGLYN